MKRKIWRNKAIALVLALALTFGTGVFVLADDTLGEPVEPGASPGSGEVIMESETESPGTEEGGAEAVEEADGIDTAADEAGEAAEPAAGIDVPAAGEKATIEAAAAEDTEAAAPGEEAAAPNEEEPEVKAAEAADFGDFSVDPESAASFEDGVLTITGDAKVSMADGKDATTMRIVIADDAEVTMDGLAINAAGGPAIKVNAGVEATLVPEGENTVTGAAHYAGIESGWDDTVMATVTIKGDGTLNATGGDHAAGIGGSYTNKNHEGTNISSYCGNILIESGTIVAQGGASGAGIGSGGNNNCNWDGSHNTSASYKMQYHELGSITISGGNVTATGGGEAAGIGGGNHTDTGMITIKGQAVVDAKGTGDGAGIGNGCGSSRNKGGDGEKGPGEYVAYVTIEDDAEVTAQGGRNSAAIGGGMYCDGVVTITGGTVTANGGNGDNGSYHHGGAGIGGGYVGHGDITITGGEINATGGSGAAGIGSGGTANKNPSRGNYTGRTAEDLELSQTTVAISGDPVIKAYGGHYGGAGIGGGVGSDVIKVSIKDVTGGSIYAKGGESSEDKLLGGAGIGSGLRGSKATTGKSDYYFTDTEVDVTITSGNVTAIGGWGASGVGSGADNVIAKTITLDLAAPGKDGGAELQAYADGTKFAIDTRDVTGDGGDGSETTSHTDGRDITGSVLQGTFVRHYTSEDDVEQTTEGLSSIQVINDKTGKSKELTGMPDGYRSFATNVDEPGNYSVYTDAEEIAEGGGRFFNKCTDEMRSDEDVTSAKDVEERNVQYQAKEGEICDNFYLFPVKTVVAEKEVDADEAITDDIDQTLYFGLWNDVTKKYERDKDGHIWIRTIEIKDGVPQGIAAFSGIDEGEYAVSELDPDLLAPYERGEIDDMRLKEGSPIAEGSPILITKITTRHGDGDDNDAVISPDVWTDKIIVINEYEKETGDITLTLSKDIPVFYDAGTDATVVFKVTVTDENGAVLYENYPAITLSGAGEDSIKITIPGDKIPGAKTLTVEEVYGAGYGKVAVDGKTGGKKTFDLTDKDTDTSALAAAFENKEPTPTFSQGVINRYADKKYVRDGE